MRLGVILGLCAGSNIVLTFFYQVFVLTSIGPGAQTDALFAGMVLPALLLAVVSGSLTHVLVPLLATQEPRKFSVDAWSFFQGIGILFTGLFIILALTAQLWVHWTVPGFDHPTRLLTVNLVRIQLAGMVFTAVNSVLWSVYHARQKFIWAELSPLLATGCGFMFLVWGISRWGVYAAAWAMVLRIILQTAMLMPGLGPYRQPDFRRESMKTAWRRICPLLAGTTYYKTDQLVDRFLASMAPSGQLSLLHIAQQIYNAGNMILGRAIGNPMVPQLAQHASQRAWPEFKQTMNTRLWWVICITVPVSIGIFLYGQPLLALLFGYGRFKLSNVIDLKWLLIALSGVWVGGAAGQILSTSFYAKGDTRTPTWIGVIGFTLGLTFKVAGFYYWGVFGIAIGTSAYYLLNAVWMKVAMNRNLARQGK